MFLVTVMGFCFSIPPPSLSLPSHRDLWSIHLAQTCDAFTMLINLSFATMCGNNQARDAHCKMAPKILELCKTPLYEKEKKKRRRRRPSFLGKQMELLQDVASPGINLWKWVYFQRYCCKEDGKVHLFEIVLFFTWRKTKENSLKGLQLELAWWKKSTQYNHVS